MICPFCKRAASKVFKGSLVYCSQCGKVVENKSKRNRSTLKCPGCGTYCTKDYCSKCGYEFKAGRDY